MRGGIQGRELFGDTGSKRDGCRLFDVALPVQGALFKFSPRLDFEMAILEDALPDYEMLDQLEELCVWDIGESNCRDANLKKMFNKFVQQIQFRRARWDGSWVVVTEYKYKSGSTIEICRICRYQRQNSSKPQREILVKTTDSENCVCILKIVYPKNGV